MRPKGPLRGRKICCQTFRLHSPTSKARHFYPTLHSKLFIKAVYAYLSTEHAHWHDLTCVVDLHRSSLSLHAQHAWHSLWSSYPLLQFCFFCLSILRGCHDRRYPSGKDMITEPSTMSKALIPFHLLRGRDREGAIAPTTGSGRGHPKAYCSLTNFERVQDQSLRSAA